MTLTTHALVGAAVAEFVPQHPILGFFLGFASHLAIDSLPHWDYKLLSLERTEGKPLENDMRIGKPFVLDLMRVGLDFWFGFIASIFLFLFLFPSASVWVAAAGAIGGIVPDPLQFVYWKTRSKILLPLQEFHVWVQKGKSLHIAAWKGLSLQAVLVASVVALVYFAR
jgi:hypothetical protein